MTASLIPAERISSLKNTDALISLTSKEFQDLKNEYCRRFCMQSLSPPIYTHTHTHVLCDTIISRFVILDKMVRAFAHGAMGRRIDPSLGGPIELFLVPASAP